MENEVTCCFEALKLRRKAIWRLMKRVDKYSFEIKKRHAESDRPILIAKEDLKNHKWVIVEVRRRADRYACLDEETEELEKWWAALVEVEVDEDKSELVGIRVLMCAGAGGYSIDRYRFNLKVYGTWWRAWEVIPDYSERPPWDDGIKD